MKKIASIAAVALFGAMAMTSCKKDYTCTCKAADGTVTASYQYPKMKKKDAESACNTWNTAAQISGGNCSL